MHKPLKEATKTKPCPHCGKSDWCYSIGNLSVCNRDYPPAQDWYQTSKCDREGHAYYALVEEKPQKNIPLSQTRTWEYLDRSGNKLVRVVRIDPQKIIWQEYWLENPELAELRTQDYWVKLSQKDYEKRKCTKAQWELFNQLKAEIRKYVPIYRYQEIKQAISENKTIFIVEGESCADKLWELGIPATTNIGGSKKWRENNTIELQTQNDELSTRQLDSLKNVQTLGISNISIVLCPDRDKPGLEHMERIYQDFPSAQWLYAFPQSPLWHKNLPSSRGLDIADWIDELANSYRLSQKQIIETIYQSIENHREITINNVNQLDLGLSTSATMSNVPVNKSDNDCINNDLQTVSTSDNHISPTKSSDNNKAKITDEELVAKLDELINHAPKKSVLTNFFQRLGKLVGQPSNEIRKLYHDLTIEAEQEAESSILQQEIQQLLTIENERLDLNDYLPLEMVKPLNAIAEILGSNSLSQITAFLPVISSLVNPDTKLTLIESSKFYARPIFYSAIVGESGSAKSPTMNIFTNPLTQNIQGKAEIRYQQLMTEYEAIKVDKSVEHKPPQPKPVEYYVTDTTSECIAQIIHDQPNKGFLMLFDELSGLIKQNNVYRGGKGADQEKILSGRDGTGWKVNRKSGDRFNNSRSTYSILGAITPDILRQQMGNCQDESGYWARFCYSYLPLKKCKFPDEELKIDIYPMLCSLYENLESLPAYNYRLCPVGKSIYRDFFHEMEQNKINEPNQAMRAIYSKFKRVAGEIALLLQSLHKAFYYFVDDADDNENMTLEPQFMAMGIKLAKRYLDEIKAIYLRHEGSREENLSPIFSRIINLSQRKGWLKARDLKQGDRYFRKLSTVDIRRHFQDLVNLGFGIVRGMGKHLEWCFSQNVDIDDNKVDANVDREIKSQSYSYSYVSDINSANVDDIDNQIINPNQNIENRSVDTKQMVDVNTNIQNKSIKTNQNIDKSLIENNEVENSQQSVNQKEHRENCKYEGLYARVPKEFSPSGILVDLREEKGFILGRQSGMRKTIKVPISKVIEYQPISEGQRG